MKEERKIRKIIPKFISGYLLGQFKVGWKSESHSIVYNSLQSHGMYSPWNCPGQNTGVGSLSLFQGTFPTQGSNPGLPHCRWILYQLSHKGGPRIPEWVFFSSGSSLPGSGIEPGSPELQMDSLPTEPPGKPMEGI